MLAGMSLGTDIKRYSRGVMPRIAIAAIVFLPLMYGALYLWAFWNPFAAVNRIPAAVVNLDAGATVQGQRLDAGTQVVDQLVGSRQLDLTEATAAEAHDGIEHGRFYFTITIPENFSKAIASPSTGNAEQAEITFTYDDTNNYLSTVIAQDAAQQVLSQVNAAVGEQTVDQVLAVATKAKPKVTQAVDGAGELAAGLKTANTGAGALASGAGELAENLHVAHGGAQELASGTAELDTAIRSATAPLLQFTEGRGAVQPGEVVALADRVGKVADLIAATPPVPTVPQADSDVVAQAVEALQTIGTPQARSAADALRGMATPAAGTAAAPAPDYRSVVNELRAIQNDAGVVAAQMNDPSSPVRQILAALQDGGLHSDLLKLRAAGNELNSGAQQLSTGLGELAAGGDELSSGAVQLHEGTEQLSAGADELAGGLDTAAAAIPHLDKQQGAALAKTLGQPVDLHQQNLHEAPTFGTGFAPFFLSLALFVGGIITWMLITPLQSRAVVSGLGAVRAALASYWPALVIGIAQVLVMYAVVHFGVGLKPVYVWGTIGFLLLVAATWMALIQAFNAIFGPAVGRVVTLAVLMLMLVSSGGIYPPQTTSKPFQILHPYDPMTYTVNGLRQLTVGGIDHRLWTAVAVLAAIIVAALACTALSAWRNRIYTMERLYPPVEV